jgi:hypothetical protein
MPDNINITVNETIENVVINPSISTDVIDVNTYSTTENVNIAVTPELTTININSVTSVSPVTSVNGQIGDVIVTIPTVNDATTSVKGIIKLAGDLAGTADLPTVPNKVDKVAGKGLSTNDYTTLEQTKLAGIQSGAEVNVNADWNATSGDAQILNKPTIPTQTSQLTNNGADGTNPFITALDIPTAGQASTLVREVKNMTGATLTKGTVVYISGANGNKPLVSKALATTDVLSARTFGLLQSSISNNGVGYCVIIGDLSGLNTSAFTEGVQLYLSGVTAGTYTSTKALAPTHLVYIGKVTRSHPTQGQIEVGIQNGYELEEIHDVAISSVADKQLLSYDVVTDLWKNKSVTTTDIADSTNKRYVTDANLTTIGNQSGTNTGDETNATIKTKLGAVTTSSDGYLTSTDWTTFNGKFNLPSLTSGSVLFSNGTTIAQDNANFFWDNTNKRFNIGGITSNTARFGIKAPGALSTDIALRVRNSADTADLATIAGNGDFTIGNTNPSIPLKIGINNPVENIVRLGISYDSIRSVRGGISWQDNTAQITSRIHTEFDGTMISMVFGSMYNGTYNSNNLMIIRGNGNVGIGTITPVAKLQIDSTTQGFLPPRMTTTQKNAIATPASGLVVYDTTLGKLCVRGASAWETITSI